MTEHRLVGQHITFDSNRRSYKGGATITAVRHPPCTITAGPGRLFRGIEYRLKPDDGTRAFWTPTMPDEDQPVH